MQLNALRMTQQSGLHSSAFQLAMEMADRMRANDSRMKQDDADNPFLSVDYDATTDGDPSAPATLCYSAACNDEQLAAFDIYEWQKRIKAALPGGRAVICRDATPWNEASKSFDWDCDDATGKGASLVIKLGWRGKNPDGSLIKNDNKLVAPSVALTIEPYIQ
jgi:type IV pilus assembly protein PilV